jgi:serine/threonine-protein kinase
VAPTAPAEAPVALTAPNIEGMDVAEARSRWQAQGISVVEDGQQADASKPAGTIVEQRPAAGAPLPEKEVRVIVAATPETLKVPDVVGQSEDDARHALVAAGFEVPPVELVGEEAGRKQGEVVRQDPNPGAQAQPGSKVQLKVVGEVVTEVVVPSVLGKPLSQGRQVLTDAGLTLGSVTNREHPEMSGRRILDQDPAPNAKVPKGTRVNLVIVAPD